MLSPFPMILTIIKNSHATCILCIYALILGFYEAFNGSIRVWARLRHCANPALQLKLSLKKTAKGTICPLQNLGKKTRKEVHTKRFISVQKFQAKTEHGKYRGCVTAVPFILFNFANYSPSIAVELKVSREITCKWQNQRPKTLERDYNVVSFERLFISQRLFKCDHGFLNTTIVDHRRE